MYNYPKMQISKCSYLKHRHSWVAPTNDCWNHQYKTRCPISPPAQVYPYSFINPGSEFRHVHLLEKLFLHHNNWHLIQKSLLGGSMWPLLPIRGESSKKYWITCLLWVGYTRQALILPRTHLYFWQHENLRK